MNKGSRLSHEIWAVALFSFAVLVILSLLFYHPADRPPLAGAGSIKELYGFVGYHLANFLRQGVGFAAFLLPIFILLVSYQLFHQLPELTPLRVVGYAIFVLFIVPMLLSVLFEPDEIWDSGGVIGGFSERAILMPLFGRIGAYIVGVSVFLLGFGLVSRVSFTDLVSDLMSKRVTARESNVKGEFAKGEPAKMEPLNIKPLSIKPSRIEKRPRPVQEKFDFMEKGSKQHVD